MKTRPSSSSLQNGKTRLPSSLTSESDLEFPSFQEEEFDEESKRR